jgi:endonuclease YncB( thermonuclease family)
MKTSKSFWTSILLAVLAVCLTLSSSFSVLAQSTTTGVVLSSANLRSGPGTTFGIAGSARQGQEVTIIERSAAGDWYKLSTGAWIAAFLVEVSPTSEVETPTGTEAKVTQIVDGDTIDVTIDGVPYRVRYILMDTPERGMPFYNEATEANRKLVQGQTVYLVKDVNETDRFGRLLRYVYLSNGTFVNLELVRQGYAVIATFPPDVAKEAEIIAAQQEAVAAGRGLWAGETTTAAPAGATANRAANLRSGPGTNYPVAGSVQQGQPLNLVAKNGVGDWYKLEDGKWIAAFLVNSAPTNLTVEGTPVTQAPQTPTQEAAPNATPVPTQAPAAAAPSGAAKVVIQSIYYDGQVSRVESDEYAVIANVGTATINLGGWRLNAGDPGQDFRFSGIDLAPGQSVRVYTNEYHQESGGFSFGSGKAIWNNKGDCGFLFDAGGNQVSDWCY